MKKMLIAGLAGACLSLPVLAQPLAAAAGVLGTLDPVSGVFVPLRPKVQPAVVAGTTPVAGRISVVIHVTLKSTVPLDKPIYCTVKAAVSEVDANLNPTSYEESASAFATRNSAATATCKVQIPYQWTLSSPGSDYVVSDYTVSSTVGTAALDSRVVKGSFNPFAVPASGQITNQSITIAF
ncbi:hypothetical protein [Derxia gummosa]|uniref:Uncharacterized protein n=1 Tax=Derxia gummosa DSM 723 TaxID=1121388 RepID=A0A8B6X518_9BURK|nr:hypothetical protein [Derxia gummosa]